MFSDQGVKFKKLQECKCCGSVGRLEKLREAGSHQCWSQYTKRLSKTSKFKKGKTFPKGVCGSDPSPIIKGAGNQIWDTLLIKIESGVDRLLA